MSKVTLLPADTYIVKNCTVLDNENRNILFKLYQPIIGSIAINLYLTLWSDLDTSQIISTEYTHHRLMTNTRIKLEDILEKYNKLAEEMADPAVISQPERWTQCAKEHADIAETAEKIMTCGVQFLQVP